MDKELNKIIQESLNEFFNSAPMKVVERGERKQFYDICPHCKKEIYEKHEYTEDGGVTWRHSDCKGLIERPEEPIENFAEWVRPSLEGVRELRKLAKSKLKSEEILPPKGDLPIGGEEKYNKQEPGGMMSTCNVDGPAWGESSEHNKKSIMDVLPTMLKIAKTGNITDRITEYLISQGWSEMDWAHESIRYLTQVNTAFINKVRNSLRDNDRGQWNPADDELAQSLSRTIAARKKCGYP